MTCEAKPTTVLIPVTISTTVDVVHLQDEVERLQAWLRHWDRKANSAQAGVAGIVEVSREEIRAALDGRHVEHW